MTRVAIIGNAGGGKSTLARQLSAAQNLPLHDVDSAQWQPGWVATPLTEVAAWHKQVISGKTWIIDGWGNAELVQARFAAADTIIFIDFPLWIHYWWAAKRQVRTIFRPRLDGPEGCPLLPMTWPLIKLIWTLHHQVLPQLRSQILAYGEVKKVFHIRSPRQWRQFAAAYATP